MSGLPQQLAKDLTLTPLHTAYYILQNRYWQFAEAKSPMFTMLRCCRFSMSNVYIGRTLYDTRDVVEW